jgi:hypothetical protein
LNSAALAMLSPIAPWLVAASQYLNKDQPMTQIDLYDLYRLARASTDAGYYNAAKILTLQQQVSYFAKHEQWHMAPITRIKQER